MKRYRTETPADDPSASLGDHGFLGVDSYTSPELLQPGLVAEAVNLDFTKNYASTRGGFVCVPELGTNAFGMAWTSRTPASSNTWKSIAFGNNLFVAVSSTGTGTRVMTSSDGITWTTRTSAADYTWNDVCYGNGKFVAVAVSGGTTDRVMYSTDGITWALGTTPDVGYRAVTYGNALYVAVGASGAVATSTDGVTWTARTGATASTLSAVAYGNGLFVAGTLTSGEIEYSTNGTSWTLVTDASFPVWTDITYGNNLFVAVGQSGGVGVVWSSPDGATWTLRDASSTKLWNTVTFGNGVFVAVASDIGTGLVMTSSTGIGWQLREAAAAASWNGVAHGNGTFVAVAQNAVMTTNDTFVYASGVYSDPNDAGSRWIMLLGAESVGFYDFGKQSRTVSLGSYTVTEQSTIVQCNNQVYIFRGEDYQPLYWTGDWSTTFDVVPEPTPLSGFETIPYSAQATFYQNRLWVKKDKDTVSASDVLDFTTYDQIANDFNLNTGSSDYIVTTFPFGENSLVVFKNKSILLLQNVQGSLSDVTVTEITRQVGAIGISSVVSVGPDLAYVSDRNINMLTMTTTNNAVQHKTLPLSTKIDKIMQRVNWVYGYKISMGYYDNKLYVALPLDNSTTCNTVVVYNFITEQWFGEWNFDSSMAMAIQGWQIATYLGLQRICAISEDGRIFVVGEGWYDISGVIVAEITTSLTTRAYNANNDSFFQRRMFMDIATNRPSFSVAAYTEGAAEYSTILSAQTYTHSQSWKFNDTTWTTTNANDDFNRAYRKDYATGPDTIQPGASGILPEMLQEIRLPILVRRQGRLGWLVIDNTQGFLEVRTVGFEARPGQRSSLVQV